MKKIFLILIVAAVHSCGPSAERLKRDADLKQTKKTGDSLEAITNYLLAK